MPSIRIVQLGSTVAFQPHRPGAKPGQPLGVHLGASVTWNNRTDRPHWPWPVDRNGQLLSRSDAVDLRLYLTDEVAAHDVSNPIYNVNPQAFSDDLPDPPPPEVRSEIRYVCVHHPEESGSIVIL